MKPGRRFGLSAEQKCDVWRRWKVGQTLHEIGRAFGKEHSSIRCLVSRHGGIAPAVRRRALLALTLREREEISRGLASGWSFREIAKCLERAVSTVSREVARHGGCPAYRASQADGEAWQSALRPKHCLLSINLKLRDIVARRTLPVLEKQLSLAHLMQHLANHSTYHRGQIASMIRRLGAEPLPIDFAFFLLERSSESANAS